MQDPPELENAYPEPTMFGTLPAYGFFIRHARGVVLDNVVVKYEKLDTRPAIVLRDGAVEKFGPARELMPKVARPALAREVA